MTKQVEQAIEQAKKKGLTIQRNRFKTGWSLTLPNGSGFHAIDDKELVTYVRAY